MPTTVFVAGSMQIKHLDRRAKERIDNIVTSNFEIVVGYADGVDSSVQSHLVKKGATKTTVYCSGSKPRNNLGSWPIHPVYTAHSEGSRAFFTAKDVVMADVADYGLMILDAKSTRTPSNVIELLKRKKKAVGFVNKGKTIFDVSNGLPFEALLTHMAQHGK